MTLVLLCTLVLLAFGVEAITGFGSTVLTVAFGAQLLPLDVLLPALVPVNMALSSYMVVRYWPAVDRRLLLRRVLPAMALGMPVGLFVFTQLADGGDRYLKAGFGLFVAVLSAFELVRARRGEQAPAPAGRVTEASFLCAAGVLHGAYASGGPLVVYVASRRGLDKAAFRATLSALWLVLNALLVVTYAQAGHYSPSTVQTSLLLVPSLLLGLYAGERAHPHVSPRVFRLLVLSLLLAGGILLLARALISP